MTDQKIINIWHFIIDSKDKKVTASFRKKVKNVGSHEIIQSQREKVDSMG